MYGLLKKMKRWRKLGNCAVLSPQVTHLIVAHLETRGAIWNFSEAESWRKDKTWIQFPFKDNTSDGSNLTVTEQDQLVDLSTDSTYRNLYDPVLDPLPERLSPAGNKGHDEPFATTCVCESAFSSLSYLKTEKLQPESNMMLGLTTLISLRIDSLCN